MKYDTKSAAARHLVYIYGRLNQPVPAETARASVDITEDEDGYWSNCLRDILTEMNDEQIDRIVYDAKNKSARSLADWYEEHVKVRKGTELFEKARSNPQDFDVQYEYALMLANVGYDQDYIAEEISKTTNLYYDFEDSVHLFYFDNGIIVLSGMDGLMAYRGMQV